MEFLSIVVEWWDRLLIKRVKAAGRAGDKWILGDPFGSKPDSRLQMLRITKWLRDFPAPDVIGETTGIVG